MSRQNIRFVPELNPQWLTRVCLLEVKEIVLEVILQFSSVCLNVLISLLAMFPPKLSPLEVFFLSVYAVVLVEW
jgi:hypothetical protein